MWRCFCWRVLKTNGTLIFSTYVEVFLDTANFTEEQQNFLHVCGGVSGVVHFLGGMTIFSPRMWRCFPLYRFGWKANSIFSTYVEVFLSLYARSIAFSDFLHVCGGVSNRGFYVSERNIFSPRMWRCFRIGDGFAGSGEIFSTYVEVFPSRIQTKTQRFHFLHVCGGVSLIYNEWFRDEKFSPRMWRCFQCLIETTLRLAIFSTYVEVFLSLFTLSAP